MKNKRTFKKYLFTMYQNSLKWFKTQAPKDTAASIEAISPVIITHFGYIVGEIITHSIDVDEDISLLLNDSLLKRTHDLYESLPLNERHDDIDTVQYITIANADVYTFGTQIPVKMKVINIFTDQIVGFSFNDSTPHASSND